MMWRKGNPAAREPITVSVDQVRRELDWDVSLTDEVRAAAAELVERPVDFTHLPVLTASEAAAVVESLRFLMEQRDVARLAQEAGRLEAERGADPRFNPVDGQYLTGEEMNRLFGGSTERHRLPRVGLIAPGRPKSELELELDRFAAERDQAQREAMQRLNRHEVEAW